MNCYICNNTPRPDGTLFHIQAAIGVCHHCGVGICKEHSHKDIRVGSPLLCQECAKLLQAELVEPLSIVEAVQ
jgi:hypothetical protein